MAMESSSSAQASEVLGCDFTFKLLDTLAILLEPAAARSIKRLRWNVRSDETPTEEYVALLDYLETELTFVEFKRALLRLCDRQIFLADLADPDLGLCRRLPLHRRFEGFLQHVFLPALKSPFKTSAEIKKEAERQAALAAEAEAEAERARALAEAQALAAAEQAHMDPKAKAKAKAEAKHSQEAPPEEENAEQVAPEEAPERTFWYGFDGNFDGGGPPGALEDEEEEVAPRTWLAEYLKEIGDW